MKKENLNILCNLIWEADILYKEYLQEVEKNGNHEGTTRSYGLYMQITLLQRILKKCFDYDYSFKRFI